TLKILNLQNNNIKDEGAEALAYALENNSILNTLSLGRNQINIDGIQHWANTIQNNIVHEIFHSFICSSSLFSSIQTLIAFDIEGNGISDDGVQYLAYALESNIGLTTLNLGRNQITAEGIQFLANALETNKVSQHFLFAH
ncbi:unnamed protein product, partial [Rotaria magnacalcarata]